MNTSDMGTHTPGTSTTDMGTLDMGTLGMGTLDMGLPVTDALLTKQTRAATPIVIGRCPLVCALGAMFIAPTSTTSTTSAGTRAGQGPLARRPIFTSNAVS
ncbi:MAG: hypothetical protein KC502_12670 [Myxococcales bacterium]|nr:hypothetical protein [Myxococcales bacterium]